MSGPDPYVYPGKSVLRNKLGITQSHILDRLERELVTQRVAEGVPVGDFDLTHLRAIHRHLFQDVYDWAGEIRTVEIGKGRTQFQLVRYIETGMADVHRRITEFDPGKAATHSEFAAWAGVIIGDINHVHPFREGNGRTQLQFFKLLCEYLAFRIDLRKLDGPSWIAASRAANRGDYRLMTAEIEKALI